MHTPNRHLDLPDEVVLAMLCEAVQDAQQITEHTRAVVRETRALLRKADRLQMPLIESR